MAAVEQMSMHWLQPGCRDLLCAQIDGLYAKYFGFSKSPVIVAISSAAGKNCRAVPKASQLVVRGLGAERRAHARTHQRNPAIANADSVMTAAAVAARVTLDFFGCRDAAQLQGLGDVMLDGFLHTMQLLLRIEKIPCHRIIE